MSLEIKKVREHYEVYKDGKFYFSADNMREVNEELQNMEEKEVPHII